MSVNMNKVQRQLQDFGLSEEEAKVYLYLFKEGMLSVLEMSKELKLSRPKLYRILDRLVELDLVARELGGGSRFTASSYRHLELVLAQKEHELARLQQIKPALFEDLDNLARRFGDTSGVKVYQGYEGLEEVYRQTFGQDEVVMFESGEFLPHKDEKFWKELQKGWLKSQTRVTMVSNVKDRNKKWFQPKFLKKCWSAWWVDPGEFLVTSDTLVFADTVVVCEMKRTGIECVEFRSRLLAMMMKRLFEFVWFRAEEMEY